MPQGNSSSVTTDQAATAVSSPRTKPGAGQVPFPGNSPTGAVRFGEGPPDEGGRDSLLSYPVTVGRARTRNAFSPSRPARPFSRPAIGDGTSRTGLRFTKLRARVEEGDLRLAGDRHAFTRQSRRVVGLLLTWNDAGTDAGWLTQGLDREFTIKTATGERKQTWHYLTAECMVCHSRRELRPGPSKCR